jgi:MSHA biogenesis protein MshQ
MKIGTDDIIIQNPDDPDDPPSGNYSLSFDGVNDYVNFGPNILSGSGDFSVSLWFKAPSTGTTQHFFQKRSSGSTGFLGEYIIKLTPDGKLNTWTHDSSLRWSVTSGVSYDDNNWHHVVIIQDNSINGGRMYVDGGEVGNNQGGVVNLRNDIITYAGADMRDYRFYFNGNIDDVLIYDSALSSSEIEQMFNSVGSIVNNPIGHWNFNEGDGSSAYNQASDNYHATINDATWDLEVPASTNSVPIANDQSVAVSEGGVLDIPFSGTDADGDIIH